MNNDIAEIFKELLQDADANPDRDINELIKEAIVKNGLSMEALDETMDALAELDDINKSACSLAKAREEGIEPSAWIENQVSEMTVGLSEEQTETLCREIQKQLDNSIKNITSEDKLLNE